MSVRLVALEFDAQDPEKLAEFWAEILGRRVDSSRRCLPGLVLTDFELRFMPESAPKPTLRQRMHFDLTSASDADQAAPSNSRSGWAVITSMWGSAGTKGTSSSATRRTTSSV